LMFPSILLTILLTQKYEHQKLSEYWIPTTIFNILQNKGIL